MAVGDVERAVAESAATNGVALVAMPRVDWLNTHGHFSLPKAATSAMPVLQRAFDDLGGNEDEQRSKRWGSLPSDLLHLESRTMVEVDEMQHFTSFRLLTRRAAPSDSVDRDRYAELCGRWSPKADRYRASKVAKGFPGSHGRARQRAYNDLLRDLVAPMMGYRMVRMPAPGLSVDEAYAAAAHRLRRILAVR
ncbi:hypothetical protein ASF87_07300 [Microbacterium sp. Leaf161]|uniref:DUF7255 family protein n=1 Tax=Microbacterium sp. Leaf161 TaxID=1736281 RepID=UPI0006F9B917|nr:hypothetical protein [Microbacterium sp. Leaf161]KQR48658.1 hypothetical protein ASF87_07300 [Microbacterium sp. Leaf161]